MKKAYSAVGVLLLVELALQFYLIAVAALSVWGADNTADTAKSVFAGFKTGDNFVGIHALNGTFLIPITVLILIALSFAAGLPGRARGMTGALLGLVVLQFLLALVGGSGNTTSAAIGGLHGLNALAIVGLAVTLLRRNWAFGKGVIPAAA